jgi:hypothetical protein
MLYDIVDREYRSVPHENKLYSRLVMSTDIRTAILERNKALQNAPGSINDLSFGRLALSWPELDYHYWIKKYPDMASDDRAIRDAALAKFMASSESIPYRVR